MTRTSGSTIETEYDPVFADIAFEWDIVARTGRMAVARGFEATLEPIRNPVTGAPHRAIIKLPEGFEFREAEMASGTFWSSGDIKQSHDQRCGFPTWLHTGPMALSKNRPTQRAGCNHHTTHALEHRCHRSPVPI